MNQGRLTDLDSKPPAVAAPVPTSISSKHQIQSIIQCGNVEVWENQDRGQSKSPDRQVPRSEWSSPGAGVWKGFRLDPPLTIDYMSRCNGQWTMRRHDRHYQKKLGVPIHRPLRSITSQSTVRAKLDALINVTAIKSLQESTDKD